MVIVFRMCKRKYWVIDYELNVRYRSGVKPPCRYSTVWVQLGVRSLPWRVSTSSTTTVTGKIFTLHLEPEGISVDCQPPACQQFILCSQKVWTGLWTDGQTENITFLQLCWHAAKIPKWLNKSDTVFCRLIPVNVASHYAAKTIDQHQNDPFMVNKWSLAVAKNMIIK